MGKLSPSSGKKPAAAKTPDPELGPFVPCDQCGFSRDGSAIARALFRIIVSATSSVDLCGHHFHEHRQAIHLRGYGVEERN